MRAAWHAIGRAGLIENERLARRFLDAVDDLDRAWQEASRFHEFELLVTPAELRRLNEQIAALLAQYRAPVRRRAPRTAGPAHVVYQAFPRIDIR